MVYRLPLQYPTDIPVTELRDLLNEHSVLLEYDFEAPHDGDTFHNVTVTLDNLACFFADLDGPGQSFPIDEFKEWAEEFRVM